MLRPRYIVCISILFLGLLLASLVPPTRVDPCVVGEDQVIPGCLQTSELRPRTSLRVGIVIGAILVAGTVYATGRRDP